MCKWADDKGPEVHSSNNKTVVHATAQSVKNLQSNLQGITAAVMVHAVDEP